jgi:hypothetical protein
MTEEWYDGLSEESILPEADRIYVQSLSKVRRGIAAGLDFDAACAAIDMADEELKKQIVDDVLKVFIAEEHFAKKVGLDEISRKLNLPVARLEKAKSEMLEDVERAAVNTYYDNIEKGTEH